MASVKGENGGERFQGNKDDDKEREVHIPVLVQQEYTQETDET